MNHHHSIVVSFILPCLTYIFQWSFKRFHFRYRHLKVLTEVAFLTCRGREFVNREYRIEDTDTCTLTITATNCNLLTQNGVDLQGDHNSLFQMPEILLFDSSNFNQLAVILYVP